MGGKGNAGIHTQHRRGTHWKTCVCCQRQCKCQCQIVPIHKGTMVSQQIKIEQSEHTSNSHQYHCHHNHYTSVSTQAHKRSEIPLNNSLGSAGPKTPKNLDNRGQFTEFHFSGLCRAQLHEIGKSNHQIIHKQSTINRTVIRNNH